LDEISAEKVALESREGFTVTHRGEDFFVKFENSAKAKWWGLAGGQKGAREEATKRYETLVGRSRAALLNL
jgi:hypothetical protein